jgi:nucleoside-diphosphate kinase
MSLPVVVQCWAGQDAIAVVRDLMGVTNGREARPGTVRGDHSMSVQSNLVHASDSIESAKVELERFFDESELFPYQHPLLGFFYAEGEVED